MNVIKSTVFAADDDDDTNNDGNGYKDDSVVVQSVDRCRLLMPTHIDFAWFFSYRISPSLNAIHSIQESPANLVASILNTNRML